MSDRPVPVLWWTANPESIARGYWDQCVLERLLDRSLWRPPNPVEYVHHVIDDTAPLWLSSWAIEDDGPLSDTGAVLVVPGAHNAHGEHVDRLVSLLESLPWWLLILTGDEERSFPIERLTIHERAAVWATSGRPGDERIAVTLGFGLQPAVLDALDAQNERLPKPPFRASFVGQDTHERRHEMVAAMRTLPPDDAPMYLTDEFGGTAGPSGKGLTPDSYALTLTESAVVPCPSGPVIPDSFRLFEAIQAGAVPIADIVTTAHGREPTYWNTVCGGEVPFPTIVDWATLPAVIDVVMADWPVAANRAGSWWSMRKRELSIKLDATVRELAGTKIGVSHDEITVVIVTSPTPSNPRTDAIETVIASVRWQLPYAEIIIAADGVRPEQDDRRADYEQYLRNLIWWAQSVDNVAVMRCESFGHQALTARAALAEVVTPLVLFLEHDTPLQGPAIDWAACADVLHDGTANSIRFLHESHVLEVHKHFLVDGPEEHEGVHLRGTAQWSQRPHLARTLWYRELLSTYFGKRSRTMIEDVMHGVVDYWWRTYGVDGWEQWRLFIYYEPDDNGSIQRSGHLDSRGDDAKYDMVYAYDGERPLGAPRPTWRDVP